MLFRRDCGGGIMWFLRHCGGGLCGFTGIAGWRHGVKLWKFNSIISTLYGGGVGPPAPPPMHRVP